MSQIWENVSANPMEILRPAFALGNLARGWAGKSPLGGYGYGTRPAGRRGATGKGLKGVHKDVKNAATALVTVLRQDHGLPAYISEGRRSQARQNLLFAQGRTRPGNIVTWVQRSKHTSGIAFDLGFAGYDPDSVPERWWKTAGEIGEALGLTWGGRWSTPDKPHFEA
ncbi:MAG: M15 family metallopeptidase [Patescibacteria group bacterium]